MPIYLQHGNMIDYVPPTDMTTDDVVFIGGLVGIPQFPMKSGQAGSLSVDGIYQFDKKEGVAVNLGDVVKYCGTTKLAQDSNADLTLGVAVAKAEANDIGVNVKINSVLPTDGGGGGGGGGSGGDIPISCGLAFDEQGYLYISKNCGLDFGTNGELYVATGSGLGFNSNGELVATGGGGSGEVVIDTTRGLSDDGNGIGINIGTGLGFDGCGGLAVGIGNGLKSLCSVIAVKIGSGLSFGSSGELNATGGEVALCGESGLYFDGDRVAIKYCGNSAITATINDGVFLKVCTASGLSIDENGYLTYNG